MFGFLPGLQRFTANILELIRLFGVFVLFTIDRALRAASDVNTNEFEFASSTPSLPKRTSPQCGGRMMRP